MEKNDLVSVVIPVYNSENFLVECIESVLNQSYKNIEIIAVNDGSTDNSQKILEMYSDKLTIISQENRGLASALNVGIDIINGMWFKWFSPDDVMYPKTIETLVNTTKNLQDNTIIYSNWDIIDKSGNKLRDFKESNYNKLDTFDFNVRLLDGQQININTTLIPFSLLSKLTMNEDIDPVLIDYDFFLHVGLLNKTKFHLIEKPLIKFRVHENQLSHKNVVNSIKNLKSVSDNILSKIDENMKIQYEKDLEIYNKNKSLSKKSMESGLKLISSLLPSSTTDKILVFYLNKIRRSR